MATIRIRDWTKERIEEVRNQESHSTHDSVIKALLKDRELAKFAGKSLETPEKEANTALGAPVDKAFTDLTVFGELRQADNGVIFLWCPNCGNEVVHLGVENPISIPVLEMECQRCLSRLDQHAIVGIEIGYPIEERIVEGTLENDLEECVIDYWDRTLQRVTNEQTFVDEVDENQLVRKFEAYREEFGWNWPTDVPIIGFEVGETYRNEKTGERIEIVEQISEDKDATMSYRIQRYPDNDADEEPEIEVWDDASVMNRIFSREMYVEQ
jgi:hypothetical protein